MSIEEPEELEEEPQKEKGESQEAKLELKTMQTDLQGERETVHCP